MAVDPIFAAIEKHDAAWLAISNTSECGETTEAMRDAETSACAELGKVTPTTADGCRAALEYATEFWDGIAPDDLLDFLRAMARSPVLADHETEGRVA